MGKIDDMRRLREEQFARNARANEGAAKRASTATASSTASAAIPSASAAIPSASAAAPRATKAASSKASSTAEEGKCPTCGKMKPLTNGLLANHQKGFGKACAGSRKEPA